MLSDNMMNCFLDMITIFVHLVWFRLIMVSITCASLINNSLLILKVYDSPQFTPTLRVIIVLCGLYSFADLHADDVNFGLTVLQHLLGRLQHLLILSEIDIMSD